MTGYKTGSASVMKSSLGDIRKENNRIHDQCENNCLWAGLHISQTRTEVFCDYVNNSRAIDNRSSVQCNLSNCLSWEVE